MAIKVGRLSKQYVIRRERQSEGTFWEALTRTLIYVGPPLGRFCNLHHGAVVAYGHLWHRMELQSSGCPTASRRDSVLGSRRGDTSFGIDGCLPRLPLRFADIV